MTHGGQNAVSTFEVELNGEGSGTHITFLCIYHNNLSLFYGRFQIFAEYLQLSQKSIDNFLLSLLFLQEYENTYEVYSAQQLATALDGSCMDLSYRTMYERGRIHITMKNVSSDYAGTYALPSSIIVAKGKQFVLDMNGLDLYASYG